ncbi:hypothetical protein ACH5RR_014835 [Cinchona calisaya]|uniref:Uncharacterized protein n=1 Tax=Cinchona calisaya TaxID=153742 RepID=A0ABD2ZRE4_9GENT
MLHCFNLITVDIQNSSDSNIQLEVWSDFSKIYVTFKFEISLHICYVNVKVWIFIIPGVLQLDDEMTKLWKQTLIVLLFRIDWRKILLCSSLLTLVSVMVQISRLPYLSELIFSPPEVERTIYTNLNSPTSRNFHFASHDQLAVAQVAPVNVSLNFSAKPNQSVLEEGEVKKPSSRSRQRNRTVTHHQRTRRRRNNAEPFDEITTPSSSTSYANMSKEILQVFHHGINY